jgi:hypothetical protein
MTLLLKYSFAFIFLFLNYSLTGQSIFSPSVQITKPEVINPTKAIIFDIDNDQLNDILVVGSYPDNIVWFKNLGDYKYSEKNPIYSNENPGAQTGGIVSDDVNGEGFIDFIAYEYEQTPPNPWGGPSFIYRKCYWRENLLGNGFGDMIEINVDTNNLVSDNFYIEDVDGDGLKDLIYGLTPHWTKKLESALWGESQSIELSPNNLENYSLGDINADGLIDIATNNYYSPDSIFVNIDINIGEGDFQFHSKHQFEERIYHVIITDYDSDGISDVIAAAYNNIYLIKQIQPDVFEQPVLIHSFVSTLPIYPVFVADVDGNQMMDLLTQDIVLMNGQELVKYPVNFPIVSTGNLGNLQNGNINFVQIFSFNNHFNSVQVYEFNQIINYFFIHPVAGQFISNEDIVYGDIDNDGDVDIICGACFYECISTSPIVYADCKTLFHKVGNVEGDAYYNFTDLYDYNGDGLSEFVVGCAGHSGDTIVRFTSSNIEDTSVIASVIHSNGSAYSSAITYIMDLNSDGMDDLIVGLNSSNTSLMNKCLIYLRNQQGTFEFYQELEFGFEIKNFEKLDLDGDNVFELLAYTKSTPFSIYFSQATLSGYITPFELLFELGTGNTYNQANVALGDINSDNLVDLYFADRFGQDGITMFGQLPLGTFFEGPALPNLFRPHVIADFNGDGNLDLYLTEFFNASSQFPLIGGYSNSILINNSINEYLCIDTIYDPIGYNALTPIGKVIATDIDGDSDLDIISRDNSRQLRVIENQISFVSSVEKSKNVEGVLNLYPNPVDVMLNLKSSNNSELGKIQIFDHTGRPVITLFSSAAELQMNLSELQSGFYFLKGDSVPTPIKFFKN